jgi:hypothetical protein
MPLKEAVVLLNKVLAHVVYNPREISSGIAEVVTQIWEPPWLWEPHKGDNKGHCRLRLDPMRPLHGINLQSDSEHTDLVLSEPRFIDSQSLIPIIKTPRLRRVLVGRSMIARLAAAAATAAV